MEESFNEMVRRKINKPFIDSGKLIIQRDCVNCKSGDSNDTCLICGAIMYQFYLKGLLGGYLSEGGQVFDEIIDIAKKEGIITTNSDNKLIWKKNEKNIYEYEEEE